MSELEPAAARSEIRPMTQRLRSSDRWDHFLARFGVRRGERRVGCTTGAIAVESGVGCAAAMILAALQGRKEASCGAS